MCTLEDAPEKFILLYANNTMYKYIYVFFFNVANVMIHIQTKNLVFLMRLLKVSFHKQT